MARFEDTTSRVRREPPLSHVLARLPEWLLPTSSRWWLVKAFSFLLVLLGLQANPDLFIILTWMVFFTALTLWAYHRHIEAAMTDLTDTQPIPVIRHVRCPRCGKEQLGPADSVVACQHCDGRMRIPVPGMIAIVACPRCNTEQDAEAGTRHTCVGCGYTDFVARTEHAPSAAAEA